MIWSSIKQHPGFVGAVTSGPARWFNCHCVTFSATLLNEGGRWGILTPSDNSSPHLNGGQVSSLLGPVWSSLLTAEIYRDALCQNVKGKTLRGDLKRWVVVVGGGAWLWLQTWIIPCWVYPRQMHFFFHHVELSGEENGRDGTKGTTPACVIIN